jgi:hypothetical protein
VEAAEIAPLRRRFAASLIDAGVIGTPIMSAVIGGSWLCARRDRELTAFRRFGESRWQLAFHAASLPIEILLRNRRTPGMRIMGLRRADAHTGGPVTVRSSVVHEVVVTAWRELIRRAQRPAEERFRERRRLMEADLEEVRRQHSDIDDAARQRAITEVFKRHGVSPWASCVRGLLGIVPPYLPALWSERNQTLQDRLAGIVVVRDRGL